MKLAEKLFLGSLVAAMSMAPQRAQAQDFSIIVMPDTQYYTYPYHYSEPDGNGDYHYGFGNQSMLTSQTSWIIANKSNPNNLPYLAPIAYVAHVGDLVEHGDIYYTTTGGGYTTDKTTCTNSTSGGNSAEWANISAAMYTLEPAGIPYGVAVGNHDQSPLNGGTIDANPSGVSPFPKPTTSCFNQYFGTSHFSGFTYFGGVKDSGKNNSHYDLITAGGQDYIIIYLEYSDDGANIGGGDGSPIRYPNFDSTLSTWAKSKVEAYPTRKAIIVTHYVGGTDNPSTLSHQGSDIYSALEAEPNVVLMIGGHVPGAGRRQDIYPANTTAYSANTITSLIADYQNDIDGNVYEAGDGFFRVYTISNARNTLTANTITNWTGSYSYATAKQDAHNAFQVQLRWSSRLDVFYRNKADNALGHIWWNGATWSSPQFLSGTMASDPAVTSRGGNLLDVFYQGTNGNLKWNQWNGIAWSGETDTGIAIYGSPSACARGLDRLDVFFKGSSNTLQQAEWNGTTWTLLPAVPVGVTMLSDPSAISWGPDRVDVVYATTTGSVGHVGYNALSGTPWTYDDRGGSILGKPGIASRTPGQLDIFGEGTNLSPYITSYTTGGSGWSAWASMPGTMGGSPSAAGWGGPGTRVDAVFEGTGSSPQLWEDYWNASTSSWTAQALGGAPAGAPAVASWSHF